MKKHIKLLVVLGILLVGSFSFYLFKGSKKDTLIYESDKVKPTSSGIAMMLETAAGSGNYEMTSRSEWPTDGYVFNANLSKCENGGKLSWDDTNKRVVMSSNISDKCYVYFDVYVLPRFDQSCNDNTLACHTAKLYTGTQGENGIYYHDASLTNGAGDSSYRYAGANPINYVCFGSTQSPCPADNLYRIIGVFGDRVKLIKSDYATSALLGTDGDYFGKYIYGSSKYKGNNYENIAGYTWNYKNNTSINSGHGSNTWSTSLLNKTNLNQNFITNIGAQWANKIDMTTWKVGGNTYENIQTQPAKTVYQNEIVNPVTTNSTDNKTEYSAKIGLMYASDYGFAAAPSAWTTQLSSYNGNAIKNVNWLYMGLNEWTISRLADDAALVFLVDYTGDVDNSSVDGKYGVRPVFYLSSSVNYVSGSGEATDPIVVN
jgi:hypothetical protein